MTGCDVINLGEADVFRRVAAEVRITRSLASEIMLMQSIVLEIER
jgi:hypothetical protein